MEGKATIRRVALTVAVLLFGVPQVGLAVSAAGDAAVVAAIEGQTIQDAVNQKANWTESLRQFYETVKFRAEQMENLTNQLSTQQANLETIRKTFTVVQSFYDKAGIAVDLYDAYTVVNNDISMIKRKIEYLKQTDLYSEGRFNVYYPVTSSLDLVLNVGGMVYDTYEYIVDHVLNSETQLTAAERVEEIRKALKKMKGYHNLLNSISRNLDNIAANEDEKDGEATADAAVVANSFMQVDKHEKEEIKNNIEKQIIDNNKYNNGNTTPTEEISDLSSKAKTMKRLASIGVTVLFVILIGWGYGVFNHGDRQRTDVLFKIFGGYIVVMVVIHVFGAVFQSLFM